MIRTIMMQMMIVIGDAYDSDNGDSNNNNINNDNNNNDDNDNDNNEHGRCSSYQNLFWQ